MRLKYRFYLARKNISKNKNNVLIISLSVMSFLLIVLSLSFSKTLNLYLVDGIMNDISYRTFFISQNIDTETEEEVISKLKNIDHIIDVFPDREGSFMLNLSRLDNTPMLGRFYIYGGSELSMPEVSQGRTIKKETEIICPRIFFPDDNLENNPSLKNRQLIRMKAHLNSVFTTNYNIYIDDENYETKTLELPVVGIYDNNPSYIDENICYASRSLVSKIFLDSYKNIDLSGQIDSILIQIDDVKNIDKVKKSVSEKKYLITNAVSVNFDFINFTKYLAYLVVISTLIISILLITYINKKGMVDKKSDINILRSLGYSKKELNNIFYLENFYIVFLTTIISSAILLILSLSINLIVEINPFIFQKIPISISFTAIIISVLVNLLSLFVTTYFYKKKVVTNNIIVGIKE